MVKYQVLILFPDDTHAEFNVTFNNHGERYAYEQSLQASEFIKTWVLIRMEEYENE